MNTASRWAIWIWEADNCAWTSLIRELTCATAAVAENLFGDATKHAAFYSLAVAGVPQLAVDEALWIACEAARSGGKLA